MEPPDVQSWKVFLLVFWSFSLQHFSFLLESSAFWILGLWIFYFLIFHLLTLFWYLACSKKFYFPSNSFIFSFLLTLTYFQFPATLFSQDICSYSSYLLYCEFSIFSYVSLDVNERIFKNFLLYLYCVCFY
jgi:hypothetical protein